jgi:hypothetical protein
MADELSPAEEELLYQMTADLGLPPEAAGRVRGTFAFATALLGHRARQLGRDVLAAFHHEHRN